MTGPVSIKSLRWSLGVHGGLLLAAVVVPLLPFMRTRELTVPSDFTVVVEENLVEPNVPQRDEPVSKKAEEPLPEPPDDAPLPVALPEPQKDDIVVDRKKKEPDKKQPDKKPPEKKPPEKPLEKKPFVKGKRIEAAPKPQQPKFEDLYKPYDPSKPVSTKPLTDKALSRADIDKALRDGARAGTRNQIPEDEVARCVVLVRRAMYEAWEQPGAGDAGARPALLDIRLDGTGRVVSYHLRQSSGSPFFDQTVLKAAAGAAPIRGLTLAFLKQYETLTVEFKLE